MLTDAQRIELERNGAANVRLKLSSYGGGQASALNGAYPGEVMTRGDVEDWLAEQAIKEAALALSTLRWAKIAGWAGIAGAVLGLIGVVIAWEMMAKP